MTQVKNYPISVEKCKTSRLPEVDFDHIPFGKVFSDHMLVADYRDGEWQEPTIMPFGHLTMHPAMMALHYGQSIFEGLKAYKNGDGDAVLFRPEENFKRFNKSAERMCMAPVPEEIWLDGLYQLVKLDQNWIPTNSGSSLYIRPFMFATDEYVGIKPSDQYRFIIFTSPVGAYYSEPVSVKIEEHYVRAAAGGIGSAKAAANYGASLYPNKLAMEQGFRQLIWTDAKEHKYIEESGTMNVFFIIDGKIVTPSTDRDTILKGITRKSVIQLARDKGLEVEERPILVEEVVNAAKQGKLQDAFGAGTAATIAHISKIGYRDEIIDLPPVSERRVSNDLLKSLDEIRLGKVEDPYGWVVKL